MKNNRINYLVVGFFVLAMLGSLLAVATMLAGQRGATDTYFTEFKNVLGVSRGTQLLYQGYPIGQVEYVVPMRKDGVQLYRLELTVPLDWKIAKVGVVNIATGLLSAVTIDIREETSGGAGFLSPGDTIPSNEPSDVFVAVANIAEQVSELLADDIKPLVEDLGVKVPEIAENARIFSEQLTVTGERINKLLDEIRRELLRVWNEKMLCAAGRLCLVGIVSPYSAELRLNERTANVISK